MILTEDDTPQRPKLLTDPSFGPTNRVPLQTDLATSGSSLRPSSLVPTLPPDYETSQAQQPSEKPRGGWRCWNGRVRKMVLYALVIYSTIALIIGIPTLMMRWKGHHKFKWEAVDPFGDSGPLPLPQQPPHKQMGLSPQELDEISVSCNTWDESGAGTTMAGTAGMNLAFPLAEGIALRLNLGSSELNGYVSGNLTVDMNPERTVSNAVLTANARYSDLQLFNESSICLTRFRNATEIMIHIPERADNSSDTVQIDLQLLLPWTSTPTNLGMFVTNLPMFNHVFGNLSHVFFEHFKIVDPGSPITVGSISATSLLVQTSGSEISGNFKASEKLYLDTINGAVFANASLHNKNPMRKSKLSIETGNGPIVANVELTLDENVPGPRHRHFITKIRTFNAPMNVSISHAKQSMPARVVLIAENVLGPMDVSLDPQYTGTFDVRSKAATVQVQEPSGSEIADDDDDDDDDYVKHEMHFVDVSTERARGWIGGEKRPEEFDRHTLGRVELINSLSPINLHFARVQ